jgi:uncharacterized membrane protein
MPEDKVMGSVELAVIEFPGSKFNGEIVPELVRLVKGEIVAILDIILVTKGDDGTVSSLEVLDVDEDTSKLFEDLDGDVSGLLSDEDIDQAGAALDAGSSALVIVWENTWARHLIEAIRGSGGRLVAHDRLDAETVQAALAELPD